MKAIKWIIIILIIIVPFLLTMYITTKYCPKLAKDVDFIDSIIMVALNVFVFYQFMYYAKKFNYWFEDQLKY